MKFADIRLGYRANSDGIEHVVLARVADDPRGYGLVEHEEYWIVLSSNNQPLTLKQLGEWGHIYFTPDDAVLHAIDRAREEIQANHEKIARLSAALAQESEANK